MSCETKHNIGVGEFHEEPKFGVIGIDIVRSDRAAVTREIVQEVLEAILRVDDREHARRQAYDAIKETVDAIDDGTTSNTHIARPKGMGQPPEEYGSASRTPQPTYRGAKYATQHFDWEKMGDGSKPQLLYIERVRGDWPKTYSAETAEDGRQVDAIAVEHPDKVPDEFVVDRRKMVEKTMADPLTPILSPMGWDFEEALNDTEQSDIGAFM